MTQALLFDRVAPPPTVTFDFYGVPAPKGSKTAVMIDGHPVCIEGSSDSGRRALKLWQHNVESVAAACVMQGFEMIDEPVEVTLEFHMPTVESSPYRHAHVVKPDLDKLCRAVFDSLTKAGVWKDDALVFSLRATAHYVDTGQEPGCTVTIVGRGEDELIAQGQRGARRR